ncbi:MAG: tRNA threonylcarbamoyladenosine dehydratase [Desulfofustis sp.]|jgi:tRNA A37 threonylcarbamoyladenosine dehydratase|nr:tRNA threonylcarbamoyladenosine dehydratase [Desulfofustis sp.]
MMAVSSRFTRTRLLLGDQAFARLTAAHVAVIGLGAVGGYAVEGLARAGVGRLTVVDFDTIQPSNINRQILALESTIGQAKAVVARQRILDINPACRVDAATCFADADTIRDILALRPDVVIDAIDSLNPKVQVLTACHRHCIAVFSSMGAALRRDPRHIKIGDIADTSSCPLARRLRKRLRSAGITSGITCVYSTEPVDFDYQPPTDTDHADSDPAGRGRTRRTLGSLPTLTALFGLLLANEVILWLGGESL